MSAASSRRSAPAHTRNIAADISGEVPLTGKNCDHRKAWIEEHLHGFAVSFGIDLLGFAILSNHFHRILRSRPDVVITWDDTEVARRWLGARRASMRRGVIGPIADSAFGDALASCYRTRPDKRTQPQRVLSSR